MVDKNKEITLQKVERIKKTYSKLVYRELTELSVQYLIPEKEYFTVPDDFCEWKTAKKGLIWGADNGYAWFKSEFCIPEEFEGKGLWIKSDAGENESLLFINNRPVGLFDYTEDIARPHERLHRIQPLTLNAVAGEIFNIAFESYGGRKLRGLNPTDEEFSNDMYPISRKREFKGIYIVERDEAVYQFVLKLRVICQLFENLDESNNAKWQASNILCDIFRIVPQIPTEWLYEDWHTSVEKANVLIGDFLTLNKANTVDFVEYGEYGFVGHSHLDTAWQWTVDETVHKAARTFSNALSLMDRYDDYIFVQSSSVYIEWMRKYYPDIYEGIKKRIADGRWEPNGGSWVECDGNMTGGEYLIRQFLRGQKYMQDNFGYKSDCFWQPDTFGYSSAIPQIMLGCGLKYFYTTKMAWNECNQFPYDTFYWCGIDGSKVLSHFNLMHCWPDVKTVLNAPVMNKDVCDSKLIAYGYGDGGGGPSGDMIETANIVKDLRCLPKAKHTTVSDFMKKLEGRVNNLPVYDGKLYLEMHRGTLTQMHDIKRSNRFAEIALRNLEIISTHKEIITEKVELEEFSDWLDMLLLNQFHDILPGSSIPEVIDRAVNENYLICEKANMKSSQLCSGKDKSVVSLYNTLSFERDDMVVFDGNLNVENGVCQNYKDIEGNEKTVVAGVVIAPLSATNLYISDSVQDYTESVFLVDGKKLETPYYNVVFNNNGEIESLFDKYADRQIEDRSDMALNTFCYGEEVSLYNDNWDINYDYKLKMNGRAILQGEEIISDGAVEYRIRRYYNFGMCSKIIQDMVFYADSPRIDFETKINWQEKHTLLKTMFPVNIHTHFARFETQFGYVERANNENTVLEKAKFEVCNHKWTDISENRYGVSILNNCKYGISVDGNVLGLTLHKGGCSPDERGDKGIHSFTYSLLPHEGGFGMETIKEGYMLNYAPIFSAGGCELTNPLFVVDASNVIIETVKKAEDGIGYILRLYEAECNETNVTLEVGFDFKNIVETNMLEEDIQQLNFENDAVRFKIKPFEIKTFKFVI